MILVWLAWQRINSYENLIERPEPRLTRLEFYMTSISEQLYDLGLLNYLVHSSVLLRNE